MADEFENLFIELFYASELWGYIGPLALLSFALILTYKIKEICVFCIPIFILMGVEYLQRARTVDQDMVWRGVFMFFGALLLLFVFIGRLKAGK